eukprot:Gregarina_sp_Poly_1__5301@NODE_2801_length_1702_cov_69_004281_g1764_i0_p2_GENE_NODE_2801_length_1702_cov_69_004281_g1764_i0NODE_2801_length_1702_cov_69_004281_g1764_i0_p2_ORF_typecomplete_len128_score25_84Ribonuc_LPSP/PF01042_21/6_6e44YjgF_endoribonc/PF14588_6/1_7e07MM_CoA_mutase/PF01642_22/0_072DUF4205/PF13898_6/0_17_NODE_2801_length_1702_cov_69_004281_g1764_i012101593
MVEMSRIQTSEAPAAIGAYAQATTLEHLVFTSGQIGLDPITMDLVSGGVEAQTEQALKNLSKVLEAAGSSMSKVVKTTVFLANMKDFCAVNNIYAAKFGPNPPARSAVQVAALPKGALVEIEAIAHA